MTFNVEGLDDMIFEKVDGLEDVILREDADILVLQENAHWTDVLNVRMDERYSYCSDSLGKCETIIYSKYPIVKSTNFKIKGCNATVINCNISINGKSIDVYGCHLCSSNYGEDKDRIDPDSISGYTTLTNYLDNYSRCDSLRASEADSICISMHETNLPTLVLGDFNCPDGSQATKIFSSHGLKDAWWEKGFGYGATIHHPLPFRIDHIMYGSGSECSEKFGTVLRLNSIMKIDTDGLSDHDALVATFCLQY